MGWLSGLFKSGKATIKPIAQAAEEQLSLFADDVYHAARPQHPVFANGNGSFRTLGSKGRFTNVKKASQVEMPKAGVESSTKEQLPLFKQHVLDGNVFNQSANTWGGLFKSGLNGMTNAVFKGEYGNWGGALRYAAPAAIMGAAGGAFGFAGSKIWPEYMSYEGTGQAVMKGAMAGIGLGLTRKGVGSMVTKLNDIKHLDYLQKPLGVVNKVAQSKVTMGALASANFMSGWESHLTRSMNPIESV